MLSDMSRLRDISSIIQFHLWILLCLDKVICEVSCLYYITCLEFYFKVLLKILEFYFYVLLNMSLAYTLLMHVAIFFNIMPVIVSKHSEIVKRQVRDHYDMFTSPSSRTAPPSSRRQAVGSSGRHRTAPPTSSDDSRMEMWEVPPPPPTRLGSSSSTYNDECPHVRDVSLYELLLDFNCLV
jgi:hypothetical protein